MSLSPHELQLLAAQVAEQVAALLLAQPELVDRFELARRIGISVPTVERMIATGEIVPIRFGRRTLFDPAEVIAQAKERGGADNVQ